MKEIIDVSDKSKNIYFDTVIYNRLNDDSEKDLILRLIKEKNLIVIPSAINLCELLMVSDSARKADLMHIYQTARNDFHPLKPIIWLLRDSVESVERGFDEWEIGYPIEINAENENICRDLVHLKGTAIEPFIEGARDFLQEIKKREELADEIRYFEYIDSENGQKVLIELFSQLLRSMGLVSKLDKSKIIEILFSPYMPWKYFLDSSVYLFYRRAFLDAGFGRNSNPGPFDIEQCAYLFWAGRFVTEDGALLDFLNRLKKIRNYSADIMNYPGFKQFLFI